MIWKNMSAKTEWIPHGYLWISAISTCEHQLNMSLMLMSTINKVIIFKQKKRKYYEIFLTIRQYSD